MNGWPPLVRPAAARLLLAIVATGLISAGCGSTGRTMTAESLLQSQPLSRRLAAHAPEYRLQVMVSWVETGAAAGGGARLQRSAFRPDAEYFYPASTIKLCGAVAAVEAAEAGPVRVALDAPLAYEPIFSDQQWESTDTTNLANGSITLGHEIRKLFLVSDNVAYNRLYDFVGQEALNRSMWRAGLAGVRLTHRLSEGRTMEQHRQTRAVDVLGGGGSVTESVRVVSARTAGPVEPPANFQPSGMVVGRAYQADDGSILPPMDFADKNRISLADLQDTLVMTVRPDITLGEGHLGFKLSPAGRAFLVGAMQEYPAESSNPKYAAADYPDSYGKFLLPGLLKVQPKGNWLICNKIGQAYGFTLENAYIESRRTHRACFVTAVIYANAGGVLNTDKYEYEGIALPFMAELGEAVGRELDRP